MNCPLLYSATETSKHTLRIIVGDLLLELSITTSLTFLQNNCYMSNLHLSHCLECNIIENIQWFPGCSLWKKETVTGQGKVQSSNRLCQGNLYQYANQLPTGAVVSSWPPIHSVSFYMCSAAGWQCAFLRSK